MNNYNPNKFIDKIGTKINSRTIVCPYCGGVKFTTTDSMSNILLSKDLTALNIGPTMPCGMIICENCGHVDFFALGILDLLQKTENSNGETKLISNH